MLMYKTVLTLALCAISTQVHAEENWASRLGEMSAIAQEKAAEYKNLTMEQAASKIRQEIEGMSKEELQDFITRAKVYLKNFDDSEKERLLGLAKEYLAKAEAAGIALKEFRDSRKD